MRTQVTAVVITLNEENDIARAVDSVSWCDEVLVVDSGSTDRTVEICRARGCRVIHRTFTGYGEQKAFAVSHATNDWVFVVDADEEVTPALRDEILRRLDSPGDCRGFLIPITTILWDQVLRTPDRHTGLKLRLFDRRFGNFGKQLVHESVLLNGPIETLRGPMYNHSYADIADYFEKFNRYTSAAALQCFLEGKRARVVTAVIRLPFTFFQLLILKGYIRDGAVGVVWSLFSAFYPAVKYLKLWELGRAASRKPAPDQLVAAVDIERRQIQGTPLPELSPASTASGGILSRAATAVRTVRVPVVAGVAAVSLVMLAVLWMPYLDREGEYAACFLFAVLVSACFGRRRTAIATAVLALIAFDYFDVEPLHSFVWPSIEGLLRLGLFATLSLLTIAVVYSARNRPVR
jgi:glycosyltransferase involved in cell wall biosynthesis